VRYQSSRIIRSYFGFLTSIVFLLLFLLANFLRWFRAMDQAGYPTRQLELTSITRIHLFTFTMKVEHENIQYVIIIIIF